MTPHRYCVVGNPVEHSKSPVIHRLFAEQTGRQLSYDKVLLPTERFAGALQQLFADGLNGCNVTVPFKEQAAELCDELTERARLPMAVNTIIRRADGRLLGDNTDGVGLVTDLQINNAVALQGRRLLILGAGGAARGIIKPLLDARPALLLVANRTADKARLLAEHFQAHGPIEHRDYSALTDGSFDLIINATSSSLSGQVPAIPESCIGNATTVYDLMYAKQPTAFLEWALRLGANRAIDGLGMLVEQAAEAFYLWEHVRPQTGDVIAYLKTG
ncbi:MAG: shikimate dehydrogenase [Gammaproteobacteria bacterium]|nr:shikimate dehydrogenase [Gammaproteobacteria bacterium]